MKELFPVTEEMKNIFHQYYKNENFNEVLIILKQKGYHQIACMLLLKTELSFTLAKADEIVLNSSAWAQEKEATITFRENFFNTLENL